MNDEEYAADIPFKVVSAKEIKVGDLVGYTYSGIQFAVVQHVCEEKPSPSDTRIRLYGIWVANDPVDAVVKYRLGSLNPWDKHFYNVTANTADTFILLLRNISKEIPTPDSLASLEIVERKEENGL
jgi:hypothetical protein